MKKKEMHFRIDGGSFSGSNEKKGTEIFSVTGIFCGIFLSSNGLTLERGDPTADVC